MRHSDQLDQLGTALAAVQASIEDAPKDSLNPHFKSKYADLATVLQTIRPKLAANGLSVCQTTAVLPDGGVVLTTTLLHKSGQWMAGDYPLEPTQRTPQGMGGAMTYARRYCLAAIVGIAQDDDDGNAASDRHNGHHHQTPPARPQPTTPKPPITFDAWLAARSKDFGVPFHALADEVFGFACDQGWTTKELPLEDWADMFEATFEANRDAYREWATARAKAVPA